MKTAISLPDDIFHEIERLSKEMHCSRSQIVAEAARQYIEKAKSRKILDALNRAYEEVETQREVEVRTKSKKRYAQLSKKDKW